jgi:hydroxymethylbilane synthase
MTLPVLRIATRQSPLALWQADYVRTLLLHTYPDLSVEIIKIQTKGDKILDVPLAKIGGKGLFIKELEVAILEDKADIAVHSMKDVPMELPEGFVLGAVCERGNPYDALVSPTIASLEDLPKGARVGTSSLRRQSQLLAQRPDLHLIDLRGNVNTRLAKLDAGEYDAIVLAAAGLTRLGFTDRIRQQIPPEQILPAVGQGAVGIECMANTDVAAMLEPLNHEQTMIEVGAERAMNHRLEGGCQVPIAGFARLDGELLRMEALVGSLDGSRLIKVSASDKPQGYTRLGVHLAGELLDQGAEDILRDVYDAEGD